MTSTAVAQRFDVEAYLKRIDSNGNGSLESNEMNGRTRDFISKMGFDVSKPISIKKVVSKVKKDRSKREKEERKKNQPALKVPGFAPEKDSDSKPSVPGFYTPADPNAKSSSGAAAPQFSEEINERVDGLMRRYDRDKNGTLDKKEMERVPWGSPPAAESDKNRDGKISRTELAQRYLDRERYSNRQRNSRGSSSSRSTSSRSSSKSQSEQRKRVAERSKFRSDSSSSSSSASGRSTPSVKKVDTKKYEAYVQGLMDRYDTNKNGKFEKEELAKMRRPPSAADTDKDGEITKSELLGHLTGASKPSPAKSGGGASTKKPTGSSKRTTSFAKRSSRGSSRTGSFSSLDENKDRQIQMHEFAKEWDDDTAKEFLSKDRNDDGILSEEEFNG